MSRSEQPSNIGVLEAVEAAKITAEWVDGWIARPTGVRYSQTHRLMLELGALCVAETLRLGEGESELVARLVKAWDIVFGIWHAAAPDFVTEGLLALNEDDDQRKEQIEQARHVVWNRRNPLVAYQEGLDSECQTRFNPQDYAHYVADYLERPWMRHPFLDWVMVDMTVSRELCAYGEELKMNWLPGRKDFLGVHERYLDTNGNLSEMQKWLWSKAFERFIGALALFLFMPVGAIWVAAHFGYTTIAGVLGSIYALIVFLAVVLWLLRLGRRALRAIRGTPDPAKQPFELWTNMYNVWRALEGPIVNPSRVRDAMVESSSKGAVWDAATWSLIDRVISIDAAVWVTRPASTL